MLAHRMIGSVFLLAALGASLPAVAQSRPDTAALIAEQREAMRPLAMMDGVWRGPAATTLSSGEKHSITQTERIGSFLGGSVKLIEGRGYDADGKVTFNALGIISVAPASHGYSMRSYALGHSGDFAVQITPEGFAWEIPAGPVTMRYTATIKDGVWHEVGDRIMAGREPVRFFEMTLKRIADTDWPDAGAIKPS